MRSPERNVGQRLGRMLMIVAGVAGGFAAFDAFLLFFIFLAAGVFLGASNPYIGLVLFVGLPLVGLAGAALAWTMYRALRGRTPHGAGKERHAHV